MSIPIVPYSAFCSLASDVLADELASLMVQGDFAELVLFSDLHGMRVALLAVGAGRRYATLADVVGVEIDGLRALCAVRPEVGGVVANDAGRVEREKDVARLEEGLKAREAAIAEGEQRLAAVWHDLTERESRLDQREQVVEKKEREFSSVKAT